MGRNFQEIADGIIKIIDEECTFDEDLIGNIIYHIEEIKKSYNYKAPELQYRSWNEIAELLEKYFCPSNSEWEEKIRQLFADEITLDEIKER